MRAEGTPPERFAIEHDHYRADLDLWATLAEGLDGPILDLGAAVGRVSLDLAARGHRVVAVDVEPRMLDELERVAVAEGLGDRIRTVCCDVRDLDLGEVFGLILMPMNTMQVFLTRPDQVAALRAVRRHLADGGEFAFDVVAADLSAIAARIGSIQPTATHDVDAHRSLAHSARFDAVDPVSGTVSFTQLIDESGPGGTRRFERPHTVHLYSPTELWELIAEAGLLVHAVYGDFDGTPFALDSERQVVRCGVRT